MSDFSEKRNIALGITGSIAAFKSAELARLLVTKGYKVRPIMSEGAKQFVTPLTMEAVTGNSVTDDFWDRTSGGGIDHIEIADWADVLLIAPATADCIAKLAYGFADTPLLAIALATRAPILVAPAMNVNMYEHPKTRENIEILRARGVQFVDPEEGALACGWNGTGRLADAKEIFLHVRRLLSVNDYQGKKILIATGPTRESFDPVRFISNRSSGKMGIALAVEAFRRGAEVTVVHGPIAKEVIGQLPDAVRRIGVISAAEMQDVVMKLTFEDTEHYPNIVIMSAAVADYRPEKVANEKIKKTSKAIVSSLTPTGDILKQLGEKRKGDRPLLVGFAVETGEIQDLLDQLNHKLKSKKADLMVGNLAEDAFDLDTNRVWIIDKNGRRDEVATSAKQRVADKILDSISKL